MNMDLLELVRRVLLKDRYSEKVDAPARHEHVA